jgi:hypothetical protein
MILLRKFIFRISITIIVLLLILAVGFKSLPLEFIDSHDEITFENLIFLGLPICILFTLTGTLKQKDTTANIIAKVLLTLFITFIPVFIACITIFDSMCNWSTDKFLFENKNNNSDKIALRSFGCGAMDSGAPSYKVFETKSFTSRMIWVTPIDTNKIDRLLWRRLDNQ